MRIISGVHKGRKIIAPNNLPIRPTTDMSKESIFNILSNKYDFNKIKILVTNLHLEE
jgi:16S rRNA G966 N2-methylase RsmD